MLMTESDLNYHDFSSLIPSQKDRFMSNLTGTRRESANYLGYSHRWSGIFVKSELSTIENPCILESYAQKYSSLNSIDEIFNGP